MVASNIPALTPGQKLVEDMRAHRRHYPLETPDQFWKFCGELLDTRLKSLQTPEKPRLSKKDEQALLFEALVTACGYSAEEMHKEAQRIAAVALANIRQVCPTVTVEEFGRRARLYRSKYKDAALTPKALSNHWHEFGGGDRTQTAKTDIYVEPPDGWRHTIREKGLPAVSADALERILERPWHEIRTLFGRDILARL